MKYIGILSMFWFQLKKFDSSNKSRVVRALERVALRGDARPLLDDSLLYPSTWLGEQMGSGIQIDVCPTACSNLTLALT